MPALPCSALAPRCWRVVMLDVSPPAAPASQVRPPSWPRPCSSASMRCCRWGQTPPSTRRGCRPAASGSSSRSATVAQTTSRNGRCPRRRSWRGWTPRRRRRRRQQTEYSQPALCAPQLLARKHRCAACPLASQPPCDPSNPLARRSGPLARACPLPLQLPVSTRKRSDASHLLLLLLSGQRCLPLLFSTHGRARRRELGARHLHKQVARCAVAASSDADGGMQAHVLHSRGAFQRRRQ